MESLRCFNLERILEAEQLGEDVPEEMNMSEYVEEGAVTVDEE